jgi:CRP-like cAMP-binding protein
MISLLGDGCPKEWIDFLTFHQKEILIEAGELIIRQGEPVEYIYSIVDGKAKEVINNPVDQRLIRLLGAGDMMGQCGLGGDWHYPVSAIALIPTTVSFIPIKVFNILSKTNGEFALNLMVVLAQQLRRAEEDQIQMPVLNRVARTMLMNYRAFGFEDGSAQLSFTISRKDIANHAATTYETAIRMLADLAARNVIKLDGKEIAILDLKKLYSLATPHDNGDTE